MPVHTMWALNGNKINRKQIYYNPALIPSPQLIRSRSFINSDKQTSSGSSSNNGYLQDIVVTIYLEEIHNELQTLVRFRFFRHCGKLWFWVNLHLQDRILEGEMFRLLR